MADDPMFEAQLRAVRRLGWTAQDLHRATYVYGDVGTVADVAEHLRTGDHLSPNTKIFIEAALWDAEVTSV